jgi:hypothetical protein
VLGGKVRGDLDARDRVAEHEHAPAAELIAAAVGDRVPQTPLCGQILDPGQIRQARTLEAPAGHDHTGETVLVLRSARAPPHGVAAAGGLRDAEDTRAGEDPIEYAEVGGVLAQVGVQILGARKHRHRQRGREIGEGGRRAARVRPHPRPDGATRAGGVPVAADVLAALEHDGLETLLEQMLGCGHPRRAAADYRHPPA